MTRTPSLSIATFVFGFMALCSCASSCVASETDEIRTIAEAYAKHRKSFTNFRCDFQWGKNYYLDPTEIEQELDISLFQHPQLGHWLKDGINERYQLCCDSEMRAATEKKMTDALKETRNVEVEDGVSIPCGEEYFLRTPQFAVNYGPEIRAANLYPKEREPLNSPRLTPFNPDIMGANELSSPYRYLIDCTTGRFQGKVSNEEVRGATVKMVTVFKGEQKLVRFGFDPQRDYMLAYAQLFNMQDERPFSETFVTDAQEVAGRRWFPKKLVCYGFNVKERDQAGNEKEVVEAQLLQVTSLEVDQPIDPKEFYLDVAAGTQVNEPDVGGRLYNLQEAQRIDAAMLPELYEKCLAREKKYASHNANMDRTSPDPEAQTPRNNLLIALNCAVLLLVCVLYWRFKKSAG